MWLLNMDHLNMIYIPIFHRHGDFPELCKVTSVYPEVKQNIPTSRLSRFHQLNWGDLQCLMGEHWASTGSAEFAATFNHFNQPTLTYPLVNKHSY